ncbi:MAG: dienelactone hydrolase family protein [Chromatiales bacterium]|nr:dienelactone hydrolase family protein [Chromatiales bacterium]
MAACASPSKRFEQQAAELGFDKQEWIGDGFTHTLFKNTLLQDSSELHVYLGGDGTPWLRGKFIALDPTPRDPVGLRLMALDDNPSVYLGRPCYHGRYNTPACSPLLWTYQRYSSAVVDSMAVVIEKLLASGGHQDLVMVGFSGGGGLAMLLAPKLPQTRQVVTLAGNLDIEAWTKLHDYDALKGSINPSAQPPLDAAIQQFHLAGEKDENIPPWMIEAAVKNQPNGQFITFDDFGHGCCWEKIWKSMLQCLADSCEWNQQRSATISVQR